MTRIFATMAPTSLGPSLVLEMGGLVVASQFNDTNANRTARATIPSLQATSAAASAKFECTFYGEGDTVDLAYVGLCLSNHPPSERIGGTAESFALDVGSGGIYSDGSLIVATPPVAKEVTISVFLDRSVSPPVAYFFAGGSFLADVELTTGAWYPAVSLGNVEAFDLRAYLTFGQRAFDHGLAIDTGREMRSAGWFRDTIPPDPVYLSSIESGGFRTGLGDTPIVTVFQPHLMNSNAITVTRKCSVWTQGGTSSSNSYAEVEVDNRLGTYDRLLQQDWRNQPIAIDVIQEDAAFSTRSRVATGIVDKIKAVGEDTIRISMRDRLVQLERPVQLRPFPPYVDAGAANRPKPIILGACRNVAPLLYDQENRIYALSDQAVTNITAVRDKGALLDPNYSPPQYVPRNNMMDIQLETLPVGLLTADVSSEGDQVLIPGADDVLNGEGIFDDWDGVGAPDGWTFTVGGTGDLQRKVFASPQDWSAQLRTTHTFNPIAGQVGSYLRYDTTQLLPGKTYRISFRLIRVVGPPPEIIGGIPAGLHVRTDLLNTDVGAVTPGPFPLTGPTGLIPPGGQVYTFTYTVPPGAARNLYFICSSSQTASGIGNGSALVQFHGIRAEMLGDVFQFLPLQGIGLTDYMRIIFENHGGLLPAEWNDDDTKSIDGDTEYQFGVNIRETTTIKEAAELPLDTFCATQFVDANGVIRTRRWRDPMNAVDGEIVASFDSQNIEYAVVSELDLAPGLTTTIGCRRNWQVFGDSDFVTDFLAVPAAVREQFKRTSQILLPGSGSLSDTYQFAEQAPPLDSLLDDPAAAQVEIDRVIAPYVGARVDSTLRQTVTTLPRFVTFTADYDGTPPALLFGDVIKVTYPRYGLDNGQKFMVWDTAIEPYNRRITITAWSSR